MSKIRKKQHSWSVPSSGDIFPLVASKKEIAEGLHKVTRRVVRRLIKIANFPECSHVERWEGEISRKECKLLIDSFYCNVFANSL